MKFLHGDSTVNEENLEPEGFIEYNDELAGSSSNTQTNQEELVSASSSKVYYSQIDSRWRYKLYTSTRK